MIHQLVSESYPCSEATVRRYIQRTFAPSVRPTMIRVTVAGEIMEVDFGYLGVTYDPNERRNRKTYLFSGRLRHSRKAYRERVFREDQDTFFACHIHAFEYFGGVAQKVVPDNLKAAIVAASFEDPLVNRAYHDLARHYGFLISAVRALQSPTEGRRRERREVRQAQLLAAVPRSSSDGSVERSATPTSLHEALMRWSSEVADRHIVRGVGRSPQDLFDSEERTSTETATGFPLGSRRVRSGEGPGERGASSSTRPSTRFPIATSGRPCRFWRTRNSVRIFFDDEQIAMHRRAQRNWQYLCAPEHAPPNVQAYLAPSDRAVLEQARSIAPVVFELANEILQRQGVDGLRPARALVALKGRYGAQCDLHVPVNARLPLSSRSIAA